MIRLTGYARFVLAGSLLFFLVMGLLRVAHFKNDQEQVLEENAALWEMEYETILDCLRAQAQFAFHESLNKEAVLQEVHAAWHADNEVQRGLHRDRLQALMEPTYANLKIAKFRHFHFHFPDCTNFLRMHRPAKFGDSLAEVRPAVVAANQFELPASGFEEGRVLNGYRNVFPLEYEGEHIGSVEISFSILTIRSNMEKRMQGRHQLIMSKEVVKEKVFTKEQSNYQPLPWSDEFVLDTAASHPNLFPDRIVVDNENLGREIQDSLLAGGKFSHVIRAGGNTFILQFIPIFNFSGSHVAYWVYLQESPEIRNLENHAYFSSSVFLLIILLSAGGILLINRFRRKLKEYRSFLPICATCKMVREVGSDPRDPTAWISVEEYFSQKTGSTITHGICPTCYQKVLEENNI